MCFADLQQIIFDTWKKIMRQNLKFQESGNLLSWLGKGSKIKLIIFMKFSANGGGGTPHSGK